MPTILVLRFPWGRYHANPWGHHVNEGAVELPPSPWRLLRALYATWRTRADELDADIVQGLLARLAVLPVFFVPPHAVAHTRHYYPDSTHTRASRSVDRTLDAFAAFGRGAELAVHWPFDLPASERAALVALAAAMPYFGRADSLCEASVRADWQPAGHETWSPMDAAELIPQEAQVNTVLAPELPLSLDALLARPVDVRRGGLLFPRGARLVGYQSSGPPRSAARRLVHESQPPTAVRFSILQPAPPPATEALIYTDLLRQAALSRLGGLREERDHTQLGGKTADRGAMTCQHAHAHYLPLCHESRLTGLLVWVPGGLPEDEVKALTSVRRLYSTINERWRATVRVAAVGDIGGAGAELVTTSRTWASATPYTPARYPKRSADWASFLAKDISRELGHRGLPAPEAVEVVDCGWQKWRRYRPSVGRASPQGRASKPSAFLRLHLNERVCGPIVLGHLSHFGLGLFTPEG